MVEAKIAIIFIIILFLIPGTAHAGGWLDLFADPGHYEWCLYPPPAQYVPIDIYLFARPPADGIRATECKMVIPDPCASITLTEYHPDIDIVLGDWETGMSLSFSTCQTEAWVLVCHLRLLSLTCPWSTDCQAIELGERDDSGFFGFATCATGFPPEAAAHMYDTYLNCDPCPHT